MKRTTLYLVSLLAACLLIFGMGAAGDSNFTNLVTTGDITTVGNVTVGSILVTAKRTALTVTDAAAFAPTGTFQPITAAGAVTPTITVPASGTIIVLVNTSSNSILLADSGTLKLSSAYTMGQYDTLTVISDGTNLYEIARSNN